MRESLPVGKECPRCHLIYPLDAFQDMVCCNCSEKMNHPEEVSLLNSLLAERDRI